MVVLFGGEYVLEGVEVMDLDVVEGETVGGVHVVQVALPQIPDLGEVLLEQVLEQLRTVDLFFGLLVIEECH